MSEYLEEKISNYSQIIKINGKEGKFYSYYIIYNKADQRYVTLKIYDKQKIEREAFKKDIYAQINNEIKILQACQTSPEVIRYYKHFETKRAIIIELECLNKDYRQPADLRQYMNNYPYTEHILFNNDLDTFRTIVLGIAKCLQALISKGIIHRDIRPDNFFICTQGKNITSIKLGDFSAAVPKNNINNRGFMTQPAYLAPEILDEKPYDERSDFWSVGITLYEIFKGITPYGFCPSLKIIEGKLEGKDFGFNRLNNPNLEILIKRLLTVDPNERMSNAEFYNYISSPDFLNPNVTFISGKQNQYGQVFEAVKGMHYNPREEKPYLRNGPGMELENNLAEAITMTDSLPNIVDYNPSQNSQMINNIIYFDNKKEERELFNDSNYFEKKTNGALILCQNAVHLNLFLTDIDRENKKKKNGENNYFFNLIISGRFCEKLMNYLSQNKISIIKYICVYCYNVKEHAHLQQKYPQIKYIGDNREDIAKNFILKFPCGGEKFPLNKLVTEQTYDEFYFKRHLKIASFYGDLNPQLYCNQKLKLNNLIGAEEDPQKRMKLDMGFQTFDLTKDNKNYQLIIREYTNDTIYGDLNRCLLSLDPQKYEQVAYFTSRLMYSLNLYAQKHHKFWCSNQTLYRGLLMPFCDLQQYIRAKGKVILLSNFTSTSDKYDVGYYYSFRGREDKKKDPNLFSVIFFISTDLKQGQIPNGIEIQELSYIPKEREILFHPFSFYYVTKCDVDPQAKRADIYLKTIGKKEILEEAMVKKGEKATYNHVEDIAEVKPKGGVLFLNNTTMPSANMPNIMNNTQVQMQMPVIYYDGNRVNDRNMLFNSITSNNSLGQLSYYSNSSGLDYRTDPISGIPIPKNFPYGNPRRDY